MFSTWVYYRGRQIEVDEHLVATIAQRGLRQIDVDILTLAASRFGFNLGGLIVAACWGALGIAPPPLLSAAESAAAFISHYQQLLNQRERGYR